jgi:hypothetical protein
MTEMHRQEATDAAALGPSAATEAEILNAARANRGINAIGLHPDLPANRAEWSANEIETAAADVIADVLHALRHLLTEPPAAEETLARALHTHRGDLEDD